MKITVKKEVLRTHQKVCAHCVYRESEGCEAFCKRKWGRDARDWRWKGVRNECAEVYCSLCAVVNAAKAHKCKKIAVQFDTFQTFYNPQVAAENFEMANFEFTTFKTRPKEGFDVVEEILLYGKSSLSIEKALKKGQEIGRAVNACRTLANTPGGDMTPTLLAKAARDAVKGLPVKVTLLGEKEMKKLGMGALLGVAKARQKSRHSLF